MWDKIKNLNVIVEENGVKTPMTFEEVTKLESDKTFSFIIFTYPDDPPDFFTKGYRKMCIDSWKVAFPLYRLIYIDVNQCRLFCKWTNITYKMKSYPNDALRPLFLSYIKNSIHCDTDVYLIKDTKKLLPLTSYDCFVGQWGCSGTWLFNRKANNEELLKWYHLYDDFDTFEQGDTDVMVLLKGLNHNKLSIKEYNTVTVANHMAQMFCHYRDKKQFTLAFDMLENKKCVYTYSKECYDCFLVYLREKENYREDSYLELLNDEADDYILFI